MRAPADSRRPGSQIIAVERPCAIRLNAGIITALISARDLFASVYYTLAPLLVTSVALALFVPSIGLVQR